MLRRILLLAACLAAAPLAQASDVTVLHAARIHTEDAAHPRAEAMA